jgi:hypothetical protein
MRISADGCRMPVARPVQAFWLCRRQRDDTRTCNGKEGVAGSSPAEGSQKPRYDAVFSFSERLG